MNSTPSSKIAQQVLAQQQIEKRVNEYKVFYKTHLIQISNRQEILQKLYPICLKFQKLKPPQMLVSQEQYTLMTETEAILKKYFKPDILELYNKKNPITGTNRKTKVDYSDSFWQGLFIALGEGLEELKEQSKQEWNYKTNYLIFLNNCLHYYGLHPDILQRDAEIYKRYNIVIEHFFKSRVKVTEHKLVVSSDILYSEFLNPYEKKIHVKMNGKLIPFKNIYSLKITSTLLLDDEIELFAKKNNIVWNSSSKDEMRFINCCPDETENFHKNPYLIEDKEKFRNQNVYFINLERIRELKAIKSKKFDLIKVVCICEELNKASSVKNSISASLLVRALIDHIPPIFNCNNFSEVANNYSGGTKSFKKSMMNLDNSLRNIADNNIHSQVRVKEVLPNLTQIDFTPELDLLLSEIVRTLQV